MYVYKSAAESRVTNAVFRAILLAAQDCAVTEGGKTPVSACKPLCTIFLRKLGGVPTFACKSERGPFVREAEKRDEKRFGTALWR